ncbi:MAG TPA: hypothetical protein VNF26_07190 [Candidatus Baltobacterales bacterium]|nr:hypothetical protein [Candidatus Baltobacterales bacterium]
MEPLRYIDLVSSVTSELPPLPIADLGPPVLHKLRKPVNESRVIIVTSAGVRLRGEPPFSPVNDLSFRRIGANTRSDQLAPSHPTPVRRPGEEDINVIFPHERLKELADEGLIGGVTPYHLSFLGTIKKLTDLVTGLALDMVQAAREAGADAALLVPL